jgi:hypothetical protein
MERFYGGRCIAFRRDLLFMTGSVTTEFGVEFFITTSNRT